MLENVMTSFVSAALIAAMIPSTAVAADRWINHETADYSIAATVNQDGDGFGLRCRFDTKNCEWVTTTNIRCTEDASTPAVLSGPKGAAAISYHCRGATADKKQYVYVLSAYDEVEGVVTTGFGIVGMAFPLESGRFAVNRFDLAGSKSAIQSAQQLVLNRARQSTRGEKI